MVAGEYTSLSMTIGPVRSRFPAAKMSRNTSTRATDAAHTARVAGL